MIQNVMCRKRKKANKLFCDLLIEQFKEFGIDADVIVPIIKFLIQHNIIRQSIVHRYVVVKIYPEYLEEHGKTKAVSEMAKILPLETVSIYSILSNHSSYFHLNRIDF